MPITTPLVAPPPRAARVAVSVFFYLMGICFASWASRIPDLRDRLGLNDAQLGAVLLGMPVGSLASLPLAGYLVTRFGSRRITVLGCVVYAAALCGIGWAASGVALAAVLVVFGVGGNTINIAMNTQAVGVERAYHQTIMSSFHGWWSVGAMSGAVVGGWLASRAVAPLPHFALVAAAVTTLAAASFFFLLRQDRPADASQPLFARPDRALLILGIIGFCCMLGEGAMADWSSIYYKEVQTDPRAVATAAYTSFTLLMAAGRFVGDYLVGRLGVRNTLTANGLLAAFGLSLALVFPLPLVVIGGFGLVGFGLSMVVPLVYSAAGRSATMAPGIALAAVSTVAYCGFLIGPPIIGFLSKATSLRVALSLVVVLSLAFAALARRVR